ncbi:MAG TPA: lipocalin-like domain-containing protein [Chitinophagaceae bacterium]|nr:lipocalin-like domain-containing protein [Chitinophagaceae bacterium]
MKEIQSLLLLLLVLAFDVFGQGRTKNNTTNSNSIKSNKLVGTWRLIEYSDIDTLTGKWTYPYGKNPRGYFTYTSTNIVNLNISKENQLKLTEDSAKTFPVSYYTLTENYSFGYFGTYSVDWQKFIVTHHVKGGSVLWYTDTDQPRPFILKGDTLIIGNSKIKKRVLVRAD